MNVRVLPTGCLFAAALLCASLGIRAGEAPIAEKFVPSEARRGVLLEIRPEATIHGVEIKLRNVCRWSDADAAFFTPLADLIIARCQPNAAFQSVSLEEIKKTLRGAGVSLATVHFAGTTGCTISRNDIAYNEQEALQQWIDAKQGKAPPIPAGQTPAKQPLAVHPAAVPEPVAASAKQQPADPAVQTMRELLISDAALQFNLPLDVLQVTFNPADEKVLALSGPQFKFNVNSRRLYNLGDVSWDVQIITDTGSKKVTVAANARAWQKQAVVTRPLAYKQVIRDTDLSEQRVLVDHLPDEPLATIQQSIGQQAARELKPGMILTSRMIDPVQLVQTGQLVSVTLNQGGISIKTVLRATESGAYGQSVHVKNESTSESYEAIVTGPQEATLSPATSAHPLSARSE